MLHIRRDPRDEHDLRETPPVVVGAVAAATAPLPIVAVYAVMFIVHGGVHKVAPPDITSSSHGELLAGFAALAVFVIGVVALLWMLSGRRRWPFVVVQLAVLGTAVDFILDETKGGRAISFIVLLAEVVALVLAFAPASSAYVGGWSLSRKPAKELARVD